MPDIEVIIPDDGDNEFTLQDWKEILAESRPSGQIAISLRKTEDAILVHMPARKLLSAVKFILGYAYADVESPYLLHRPTVPLQHPMFPWLNADGLSATLKYPVGNPDQQYLNPLTGKTTMVPRETAVFSGGYGPEYYGKYAVAEVLVRFSDHQTRYISDDDPIWQEGYLGKEWIRSVSFSSIQPKAEAVAVEGATDEKSLYWCEYGLDDVSPPIIGPGNLNPITAPVYTPKIQASYQMVWRCVPETYICPNLDYNDPSTLVMPYPERLLKQLGSTNSKAFPSPKGHQAGTLLFDDLKMERYRLPVLTNGEAGLYAYDIYFTFTAFNPKQPIYDEWQPVLGANINQSEVTRFRGHQLYPWRTGSKGYWYGATRGKLVNPYTQGVEDGVRGTYGGANMVDSTDFFDLFRSVNDTTAYPLPW
jgi:hypothetical protein